MLRFMFRSLSWTMNVNLALISGNLRTQKSLAVVSKFKHIKDEET